MACAASSSSMVVQDFMDWQHGPDVEVWMHDHDVQQAGSDGALHKMLVRSTGKSAVCHGCQVPTDELKA